MLLTPKSKIITEPNSSESGVVTHPMNVDIRCLRIQATTMFMKRTEERDPIWCKLNKLSEQSFVGVVQECSDKSVTALRAEAFESYPIDLKLHNVTKEWTENHVQHIHTIAGYRSIQYESTSDGGHKDDRDFILPGRFKILRMNWLRNLYYCIKGILQPFANAAIVDVRVLTSNQKRVRKHIVM